jgi:hypothetical protein
MQVADDFDNELFDVAISNVPSNVPVSKKKGKGKQRRRQRAIYSDDEDEDMEKGNDETPRSPDSPGGVSVLINEV